MSKPFTNDFSEHLLSIKGVPKANTFAKIRFEKSLVGFPERTAPHEFLIRYGVVIATEQFSTIFAENSL